MNQYPIQYLPAGIVTSVVVNGTSYPTEEYFNFPIAVGDSAEGTITILETAFDILNFQSGATVELKFTTAQRNDYSYWFFYHNLDRSVIATWVSNTL